MPAAALFSFYKQTRFMDAHTHTYVPQSKHSETTRSTDGCVKHIQGAFIHSTNSSLFHWSYVLRVRAHKDCLCMYVYYAHKTQIHRHAH